ncbi:hypothetical protein C8J37_1032 [Rhizobium sp. PP-WC-1G-195]|nr:hypothetical protein C8J37_1032 [Rhizobium sp. PP-WC-1G-195]
MTSTAENLVKIAELRSTLSTLPDDIPVPPHEASEILAALGRHYTRLTLRKLRCTSSKGPRYQKAPNGRITYLVGDLRAFACDANGKAV